MGRRGPLAKPTALKILQGNPGKRPLPKREPKPKPTLSIPQPPDHLPALGKSAWQSLASPLHALDLLTDLDLHALESYCTAYAFWRLMLVEVQTRGHTLAVEDENGNLKYTQPTPEARLMLNYAAEMSRWSKVLGLGPAYRVGLNADPNSQDDADPLIDALGG